MSRTILTNTSSTSVAFPSSPCRTILLIGSQKKMPVQDHQDHKFLNSEKNLLSCTSCTVLLEKPLMQSIVEATPSAVATTCIAKGCNEPRVEEEDRCKKHKGSKESSKRYREENRERKNESNRQYRRRKSESFSMG